MMKIFDVHNNEVLDGFPVSKEEKYNIRLFDYIVQKIASLPVCTEDRR